LEPRQGSDKGLKKIVSWELHHFYFSENDTKGVEIEGHLAYEYLEEKAAYKDFGRKI